MTLVKQNYKGLDNLFDEFFKSIPAWNRESQWSVPPVNIDETANAYHLEVVAPGLNKEDIKVNLEKGLLTISYEKKVVQEADKDKKPHRREYSYSSFKRSFNVDDQIEADKITAKYENGVLKVDLPKKEVVKVLPKEIEIK